MKKFLIVCSLQFIACSFLIAQNTQNNASSNHGNKFEQLGTILPTPNEYRTASGARAQNTGSSVVTTISNVNLMKKI